METLLDEYSQYLKVEDINLIREFIISYQNKTMFHDISNRKGLYFYGTGSNGKTTFIKKIIEFLGTDNCQYIVNFNIDSVKLMYSKDNNQNYFEYNIKNYNNICH